MKPALLFILLCISVSGSSQTVKVVKTYFTQDNDTLDVSKGLKNLNRLLLSWEQTDPHVGQIEVVFGNGMTAYASNSFTIAKDRNFLEIDLRRYYEIDQKAIRGG